MIKTGQKTTTALAVQLPSVSFATGLVSIKAPSDNQAALAIGSSGVNLLTGFLLYPGESVEVSVLNLNSLYLIGNNGTDKITWIGF